MKLKRILLLLMLFITVQQLNAQNFTLKGKINNTQGVVLPGASIMIKGTTIGVNADDNGYYVINNITEAKITVIVSYMGYETIYKTVYLSSGKRGNKVNFSLQQTATVLQDVEVFGTRGVRQEKLDVITRMPLRVNEQIQSISVISRSLIRKQAVQTLTDATQNVVGVSQWANYGGASESMSLRGYRGVPTLKNGIRVDNNFRGLGFNSDMQGVESIQVLKGSAAITQGVGSDLGSAGGVINIATKTPKFLTAGEVGLRGGSWGLLRTTMDVQTVLNKEETMGIRLNGALQRSDSYTKGVSKNRMYVNPSFAWKANDKTKITAELDYFYDSFTPNKGTINMAGDSVYNIYDMPNDKFLGFVSDRVQIKHLTTSLRVEKKLTNNLSINAGAYHSDYASENVSSNWDKMKGKDLNIRKRSLSRGANRHKNTSLMIDLVGQDMYTGTIKHTFQVGADFKQFKHMGTSYDQIAMDTIDVFKDVVNTLPHGFKKSFKETGSTETTTTQYGLMAQDVITFNKYFKLVLGLRYSYFEANGTNKTIWKYNKKTDKYTKLDATAEGRSWTSGDSWNPIVGIIVSPIEQINLFGSFTNTTDFRSAGKLLKDGSLSGASPVNQFEAGVKSEWFDKRLRFNATYFNIRNNNLYYTIYENGTPTLFSDKAGDIQRQGIELELSGRILPNLEAILGYSYTDAQYKNSPSYVDGSAPINATKNTANAWLYYTIDQGSLNGLSFGVGLYYVGKRPANDYSKKFVQVIHDTAPGVKPFDMPAYTTLNAQVAYAFDKFRVQAVFNNILNELGYTSYYRGGYINKINPFNFSLGINYTL